jgi:hypothetical protein
MSIERRLADAIGMGTCATPHAVLGWTTFEQLADSRRSKCGAAFPENCGPREACLSSVQRSHRSLVPAWSFHCLRQGPLGVAIVFPRATLYNQAWHGAHGESLWIETFLHLVPR